MHLNYQKKERILFLSILFIITVFYCYLSHFIDFHPDETIYYDAIPVNVGNDSGLFYHLYYLFISNIFHHVQGARYASVILGTLILVPIYMALSKPGKEQSLGIKFFILSSVLFSYQFIFVFERVRPEAAWWFLTFLTTYVLAFTDISKRKNFIILLMFFLVLPMNHRLVWFPSFFLLGYVVLFTKKHIGYKGIALVITTFLSGIILNVLLRAVITSQSIEGTFNIAFSGIGLPRQSFAAFFDVAFWGGPKFLNDVAAYPNIYKILFGAKIPAWFSHEFVQNSIWGCMLILPLLARSFKEAYLFSFPLVSFFGFYVSGYFNPTYTAGFSLVCILILGYILATRQDKLRLIPILILSLSLINGLSFISTRIVNHGYASYFVQVEELEKLLKEKGYSNVAMPERFQLLSSKLGIKRVVNFKSTDFKQIDALIYDNYDENMYGFVPDFETRKVEIHKLMESMCLVKKDLLPVYYDDTLYSLGVDVGGEDKLSRVSSWFFRNSASYTLSVYEVCK